MKNVEKWSLGKTEVGKTVGSGNGKSLKIWVGKIMPLIPYSTKAKTKTKALDKGFLINDEKCKPKVSPNIKTSNFMSIPTSGKIRGNLVSPGTKVNIDVDNNSVDQLTIINNVQ